MAMAAVPLTPEQRDDAYMHLMPQLEEQFEPEYSDELEYHGWAHGLQVADKSLENREILLDEGITDIDGVFATRVRGLGHDAGMLEFFKKNLIAEYSCPELFSMAITERVLKGLHVDTNTINSIVQPILGTKCGVECKDIPSYVLCASDVDNSEQPLDAYDTVFASCTAKLRREYILLKGEDLGREGYDDFSLKLLAKYCMVNLNQPHILERSPHLQVLRAHQLATLGHLATIRAKESRLTVVDFAKKLGDAVPQMITLAA